MGAYYFASMCLHATNTAYCTMHTVLVCRALAYGSDCLDTIHIETRMDIGVETSCANTGVLVHIDGERRAMKALSEIG